MFFHLSVFTLPMCPSSFIQSVIYSVSHVLIFSFTQKLLRAYCVSNTMPDSLADINFPSLFQSIIVFLTKVQLKASYSKSTFWIFPVRYSRLHLSSPALELPSSQVLSHSTLPVILGQRASFSPLVSSIGTEFHRI